MSKASHPAREEKEKDEEGPPANTVDGLLRKLQFAKV
jgi:hypothetical protein